MCNIVPIRHAISSATHRSAFRLLMQYLCTLMKLFSQIILNVRHTILCVTVGLKIRSSRGMTRRAPANRALYATPLRLLSRLPVRLLNQPSPRHRSLPSVRLLSPLSRRHIGLLPAQLFNRLPVRLLAPVWRPRNNPLQDQHCYLRLQSKSPPVRLSLYYLFVFCSLFYLHMHVPS